MNKYIDDLHMIDKKTGRVCSKPFSRELTDEDRKIAELVKNSNDVLSAYFSGIGKKGGQKSKRKLTREQSLKMLEARKAKKDKGEKNE